ncbi:MAG: hypothetical protein UU93_C0006G0038 [Candidatus Amesbacteria bacterium GW2011_GWA2_42_12]|uniref:Uncharacterized protein n=1 Tax=Candidatus Amesbacteria bacterium GW2011_GWA2_42_12 TaxID=1618356 RepID=A0A0G0Y744_9BACT|nr:MAG: hypothetical protein UU93_C0006G0038 [Candidatus Amesbacteria bacterium GW2011_GWA2_42_12]
MAATLNQDDIKLLKSIFATKNDLVAMEKRQNAKYATKNDLVSMEKRQNAKFDNIEKRFDDMDVALAKYSQEIEARIENLEDAVGIPAVN